MNLSESESGACCPWPNPLTYGVADALREVGDVLPRAADDIERPGAVLVAPARLLLLAAPLLALASDVEREAIRIGAFATPIPRKPTA